MMSKPKPNSQANNLGFTLIELMVVIFIMVLLSSVLVLDLARQQDSRNIKIAQSNLVTKIRQIQSYSLSGRNLNSSQSVQYYILKIDLSRPTQYTIQALYSVGSSPQLQDIETIQLPKNMQFQAVDSTKPIVITRPGSLSPQNVSGSSGCLLVAFKIPFGQTMLNPGCSPSNRTWDTSDDYQKFLNFVINDPGTPVSVDSIVTFALSNAANSLSNTITINGITGAVSFQ